MTDKELSQRAEKSKGVANAMMDRRNKFLDDPNEEPWTDEYQSKGKELDRRFGRASEHQAKVQEEMYGRRKKAVAAATEEKKRDYAAKCHGGVCRMSKTNPQDKDDTTGKPVKS